VDAEEFRRVAERYGGPIEDRMLRLLEDGEDS
jgi:hypothetical protein